VLDILSVFVIGEELVSERTVTEHCNFPHKRDTKHNKIAKPSHETP
jgi:hypothetical protein